MFTNLRGSYEEMLAILGLRTLEDRRLRGDLIEAYKILTGKSDVQYQTWFQLAKDEVGTVGTRAKTGHLNLSQPPKASSDVRKNFFSHRVVSHWNQLPDHVKLVQKTNDFKNAYDSHTGYGRTFVVNQ